MFTSILSALSAVSTAIKVIPQILNFASNWALGRDADKWKKEQDEKIESKIQDIINDTTDSK